MANESFTQKLGGAASTAAYTIGGALVAGYARKKVSFLDTTIGKFALIIAGLMLIAYTKSNALKGVGVGIATNGALGFASSLGLAGVDGLGSVGDGMGAVVQDENGMVYMVNGVGDEFTPYELPMVSGIGSGEVDQAFSGFGAANSSVEAYS